MLGVQTGGGGAAVVDVGEETVTGSAEVAGAVDEEIAVLKPEDIVLPAKNESIFDFTARSSA